MPDTPDERDERVTLFWWDHVIKAQEERDHAFEEVFAKRDLAWKIVVRRCAKLPQLVRIRRSADRRYLRMKGFVEQS
jgi:hypothetical protein